MRRLSSNLTRPYHDLNAYRRYAVHNYKEECRARGKDCRVGRELLYVEYSRVVVGASGVRRIQLYEPLAHVLCVYNVRTIQMIGCNSP